MYLVGQAIHTEDSGYSTLMPIRKGKVSGGDPDLQA